MCGPYPGFFAGLGRGRKGPAGVRAFGVSLKPGERFARTGPEKREKRAVDKWHKGEEMQWEAFVCYSKYDMTELQKSHKYLRRSLTKAFDSNNIKWTKKCQAPAGLGEK